MTEATHRAQTLLDKIWTRHRVVEREDGQTLLYVDCHLLQDGSAPAFEMLRGRGLAVHAPRRTFGTPDHYVPTQSRDLDDLGDPEKRHMAAALARDTARAGITLFGLRDSRQGIVHVVGPEQGLSRPGMVIVCGDSHTSTHGALGALAFGIGTSEVAHVLATQSLWQRKPKTLRIVIDGPLRPGVTPKDVILAIVARIGAAGATGHVIEYAGSTIGAMSMEGRLTICNMSIEAGARAGMIAPDDTTFEYLAERPYSPRGVAWDDALMQWRNLRSDAGAAFDREIAFAGGDILPMVTWGTSPENALPITGHVPDPATVADVECRGAMQRALDYMGLQPGAPLASIAVDRVFIGSCTNSRIEDLRAAAAVVDGRTVAAGVEAWVVPGSGLVKAQAEAEGLDRIFLAAGLQWRHAGCSMCLGVNGDIVLPGQRCASTSNRNFVGRQGPGARTHLMSPGDGGGRCGNGALDRCASVIDRRMKMEPLHDIDEVALPIARPNVDTDQIIPARYLQKPRSTDFGPLLFRDLRFRNDGSEVPDFILNRPSYRESRVIVAEDNFGCGSSREHAVWALCDYGFRVAIAPSFGDIFHSNALKNGLLPVVLPHAVVSEMIAALLAAPGTRVQVDLEQQRVGALGRAHGFDIDPFPKRCLREGLDELAYTLTQMEQIRAFEANYTPLA